MNQKVDSFILENNLQNVCDVMNFIKQNDFAKETNYSSLFNLNCQKVNEIYYLRLMKYSQIYINKLMNITDEFEIPNLMYKNNENTIFDCYNLFSNLRDIQEKAEKATKSAEKQNLNGKIWYCQICNTENNPHETLCMACDEERCLDSREFEMNENYEDNGCDETDNEQEMEQSTLDNCEMSSVNYNEEERNDDCDNNDVWKCMSCNFINNSVYVACGVNKDGKVDVPESHVMWRCTKCGIDNLLSNRTCVGCDAIDPNIDKWVCEQCSLVNAAGKTNFENNSQSKEIGKESDFDNYRTSSVNYNEEERNGDCVNNNNLWKCMSCNIDNWINNSVCVACGVNKDGKVDVPESHVMWRCTKCGIDNLLSNRTCVGCDAVDPNIDKWVCEQCSLVNEKCAVECSVCGTKNNNFVKCTMCSKASVFVWDGTVCEDCLRKVQNSEKCENCKQIVPNDDLCKCTMSEYDNVNETEVLCKLCRKYPINSNSTVNDNLLCNKCLKEMGFCRNCGTEVKIDSVMCLKCSVATWICDKCEYINSYSCVTCKSCKNSRLSNITDYLAQGLI